MKKTRLFFCLLILSAGLLYLAGCNANESESNPDIDCTAFSEEECFQESDCRGNYGPSSCSGMICTGDMVFHSCSRIPDEVLQEAEQEKQLCEKTGGSWYRDKFGEPGRCQCDDKKYFKNEGCVSVEDDCERLGGTFYEPETLECTDQLKDIHYDTCAYYDPETPECTGPFEGVYYSTCAYTQFNRFPECVCPSGDIWDSSNRCAPEDSLVLRVNEMLKTYRRVDEVSKPYFDLPEDIDEGQIRKYFQLNDIYFALVLQSSMNFALELPEDFRTAYAGILIAFKGDKTWKKLVEIQDGSISSKNNPYYLWSEDSQLHLTVVDQNGAGSGEGMLKSFTLSEEAEWKLNDCYYFGLSYNGPGIDGDYLEFSTYFEKQEERPIEECEDVTLINY